MAKKFVYFFGDGKSEGRGDQKELLGGKGANLGELTRAGSAGMRAQAHL